MQINVKERFKTTQYNSSVNVSQPTLVCINDHDR